MKALLDFVPLIIFFYLYKTVDPKDTEHPLLHLIGSAGGIDNNNILVATAGLIISNAGGVWRLICQPEIPPG